MFHLLTTDGLYHGQTESIQDAVKTEVSLKLGANRQLRILDKNQWDAIKHKSPDNRANDVCATGVPVHKILDPNSPDVLTDDEWTEMKKAALATT